MIFVGDGPDRINIEKYAKEKKVEEIKSKLGEDKIEGLVIEHKLKASIITEIKNAITIIIPILV